MNPIFTVLAIIHKYALFLYIFFKAKKYIFLYIYILYLKQVSETEEK